MATGWIKYASHPLLQQNNYAYILRLLEVSVKEGNSFLHSSSECIQELYNKAILTCAIIINEKNLPMQYLSGKKENHKGEKGILQCKVL